MNLPIKEILPYCVSVLAGGVIVAFLRRGGFSLKPTKVSLPFVDLDVTRFSALTPVQVFNNLTRVVLPANREAAHNVAAVTAAPILMIHAGWNIVCDAFIRRFDAYPEDDHINSAAAAIGGQNVEFLRTYRDIYRNASRYTSSLTPEFAADYIVRAPSLAERIAGARTPVENATYRALLEAASEAVHRS